MTTLPHTHRVLERLDSDLAELADLSLPPLADDEITHLLDQCTALTDRLSVATARIAAAADQRRLGDSDGSRHTAHWWARRANLTRGDAGRRLRFGHHLAHPTYAVVATALLDGELRTDQAQVIIETVEDLPDDLDPGTRTKARDHLLSCAREHDARALRILGKRILEVIDPDRFEEEEGKRLEREERHANATARITLTNDGKGRVWGRFNIPALHGELLRQQILALADPRRDDPEPTDAGHQDGAATGQHSDRRSGPAITPERMGHAFMELIESFPADRLPSHAGSTVALNVTIDLSQLRKELGVASLEDGTRISAAEARRLACRSGILPAVLDGSSEVLDLGRTRRLFSTAQFRALALRDKGCTAEGCGMPSRVCHAHHDIEWSRGGATDLTNGRLLCPHHHRLMHDPRYRSRSAGNGMITFHRRN
ncbi:DUF222 domain-containing protein [Nocardioides sp. AE5]|uniref:HNH endonuclease signature motif containing protein n=1 Tax=Nocardioides sp. AE5 TaxID=2962573 RepID=UPI002881905C|nr:DUF222 domain-containing protein [Nocardioides sp. AE5]MDT0203209.1 DUF222 domain-containing protein [Nocardioides sp. AE5]